jgi:hypothetical protein
MFANYMRSRLGLGASLPSPNQNTGIVPPNRGGSPVDYQPRPQNPWEQTQVGGVGMRGAVPFQPIPNGGTLPVENQTQQPVGQNPWGMRGAVPFQPIPNGGTLPVENQTQQPVDYQPRPQNPYETPSGVSGRMPGGRMGNAQYNPYEW